MDITTVIAILTAALGSLVAGLLAAHRGRQHRKNQQRIRDAFEQLQGENRNRMVHDLAMSAKDLQTREMILKELIVDLGSSSVSVASIVQKEDLEQEVEQRTAALKERLQRIEDRFPEESTLEKIASVNDAIMATKIEELEKSAKRIEDKILTKWDVAMIVFTIIGALGALVGLTFGVVNFAMRGGGG